MLKAPLPGCARRRRLTSGPGRGQNFPPPAPSAAVPGPQGPACEHCIESLNESLKAVVRTRSQHERLQPKDHRMACCVYSSIL